MSAHSDARKEAPGAVDVRRMPPVRRPRALTSSIRRRYVGFAVLTSVLIAAACGLFAYALVLGSHTTRSWRLSAKTIAGVDKLNSDLLRIDSTVQQAIDVDREAPIEALLPTLAGDDRLAQSVLASAETPAQRALVARLRRAEAAIVRSWIDPGVSSWGHTPVAEKQARQDLVDRQIMAGQKALLAFAADKQQQSVATENAASRLRAHLLAGAGGLVALVVGLMLLAAIEVRRTVVRPALALQRAVTRVAGGDLDTPVPLTGPEELATVAAEVDRMRLALHRERDREEERTQARLELAAAKQEAARLESLNIVAAGVAHDFNNLLQAIIGQTELLRASVPELAQSGFADIEAAAWQAARLARKMLVASGHGLYVRRPVAAAELATTLRETQVAGVTVSVGPAALEATLLGDEPHVRQALGSVVANASEAYGDEPGEVVVTVALRDVREDELTTVTHSAALPGTFVVFAVADQGEGMSAETLARACDPFYTTRFAGRGLGLATALGIVRAHRGALDLASTPGSGTTVRLFFPAAPTV
jgi:signal transduction histidine kinase